MNTFTKIASAVFLVTGATLVSANASSSVDELRNVEAFTKLKLEGSLDIILTQDNKTEVKVEGDAESVKHVVTEVKNGTLYVHPEEDYHGNISAKVYVHAPSIEAVKINGSGDVTATNTITSSDLALAVQGSGDIKMDVKVTNLAAAIQGSGDISLTGSAGTGTVSLNGSGDLRAKGLNAKNMSVTTTGSADCTINVSDALTVAVAGSGDVRYTGNVKNVTTNVVGSGTVTRF